MIDLFLAVFSTTFFVMVVRTATPLLFATLGGLISDLSGALNVALEGMMLISALTAVVVSVYAPWYVAVVAGIGAGAVLGALMGLFHLKFKADIILVGFAVNILAAGGTAFALSLATGGDKGTSINLTSKSIPAIDFPFLEAIPGIGPLLDQLLSGHSTLSWLAAFTVFALWYFLYRMPQGLWLRAVGEYPAAPEAGGYRGQQGSAVEPCGLGGAGRHRRRTARHVQLYRVHPRHDGGPRLHRARRRAARGRAIPSAPCSRPCCSACSTRCRS